MTIEETIYTRLSEYAGLQALVVDRVYPNKKAQDAAMPAVVYRQVSATRYPAMGVDAPVVKSRWQIDAWGATYDDACAVRDQVRAAMQRWRTTVGTTVLDTFFLNSTDLVDPDTRQDFIAIDIEINYIE